MIGIDTNVLVRIVYDDLSAPEQCEKARSLVSSTYLPLLVNNIVLVETVVLVSSIKRRISSRSAKFCIAGLFFFAFFLRFTPFILPHK